MHVQALHAFTATVAITTTVCLTVAFVTAARLVEIVKMVSKFNLNYCILTKLFIRNFAVT